MSNLAERIGSVVFLVCTGGYLALAAQLPSDSPNLSDLGPRVYPLLLGIIATAISVFWVVQSYRPRSKAASNATLESSEESRSWWKIVALIVTAFLFPLTIEFAGFIITTSLVIFLLCNIIMWKKPTSRQILISLAFAVVSAIALQLLFENVMAIYLP